MSYNYLKITPRTFKLIWITQELKIYMAKLKDQIYIPIIPNLKIKKIYFEIPHSIFIETSELQK